jgi:hypothetical protein
MFSCNGRTLTIISFLRNGIQENILEQGKGKRRPRLKSKATEEER